MMDENKNNNEKIKEFSKESLRNIAKEIIIRRTTLKTHLIAYFCVNLLLFSINMVQGSYLWFIWPITSWGMAVLIHILNYIKYKKGLYSKIGQTLIAYHIIIYIIVSGYLFFVNYYTTGLIIPWFLWPLIFWGLGVILHIFLYNTKKPKKDEDPRKSWLDRKIDKELGKIKEE